MLARHVKGEIETVALVDGSSGRFIGDIEGLYQGYRVGNSQVPGNPVEQRGTLQFANGSLEVVLRHEIALTRTRADKHPFADGNDPFTNPPPGWPPHYRPGMVPPFVMGATSPDVPMLGLKGIRPSAERAGVSRVGDPPTGMGGAQGGPPPGMGGPQGGPPTGMGGAQGGPPMGMGGPQGGPPMGMGGPQGGPPVGMGGPQGGPPPGMGGPQGGPPPFKIRTLKFSVDGEKSTGIYQGASGDLVLAAPAHREAGYMVIETREGNLQLSFRETSDGRRLVADLWVDGANSTGIYRNARGELTFSLGIHPAGLAKGPYEGTILLQDPVEAG